MSTETNDKQSSPEINDPNSRNLLGPFLLVGVAVLLALSVLLFIGNAWGRLNDARANADREYVASTQEITKAVLKVKYEIDEVQFTDSTCAVEEQNRAGCGIYFPAGESPTTIHQVVISNGSHLILDAGQPGMPALHKALDGP